MANIILEKVDKKQNIGNSLDVINSNFKILDNSINSQKEDQLEIQDFVDSVNNNFSDLKYSLNFFKKNYKTYLETMENIINNKEKYLKPIVTIYPEKFRYDNPKQNNAYIENVIHDWVTSKYTIYNRRLSERPFYVEGQAIIIYFLRSSEKLQKSTDLKRKNEMLCETSGDQAVNLKCKANAYGSVSIDGCGTINCGGELNCDQSNKIKGCHYDDDNNITTIVSRYVKGTYRYNYIDYTEDVFEYIKFIVEDCTWKIDNSPSSSITPYMDIYKEVPMQVQENSNITITDNSGEEISTFTL